MLKVMRDSFHHLKWVLLAVVAAFIFGFVFIDMGMGGAPGGAKSGELGYAARVNGETVSFRDFDRALYYAEENYKQMYGAQLTPEMLQSLGLQRQVMDALVDRQLLLQEARRLHLEATPEEVRKRILEIPILNPDGKFVGQEYYTRFVTSQGFQNASEFEAELGREITLAKIEGALSSSIVVSPKVAEAEYRRQSENAKVRYVLYPGSRVANVTVTPAEVEQHYRANQAIYSHGEQRNLKYLLADYSRLRAQVNPSEADLRKRYLASKESFRTPPAAHVLHILIKVEPGAAPWVDSAAKVKAESLVAQLRAGGDFAAIAKVNSADPSSSGNGGDMGWVEQGQTVEPFDQAIFSLPENQISDPIRSEQYGYHIVRVVGRREAAIRPFEDVRVQLAEQAAEQMGKDQAREEMSRIAARIKQKKPATPDEFTALANDKISSNETQWFQKAEGIPGIGFNSPISTWAFSAGQGDIGDMAASQRGIVIPYLLSVRPAGVTPLAEIRERVEADLRAEKSRKAAREAMVAAMAGAPSVDAVAGKLGLSVAETTVGRQGMVAGLTGDTTELVNVAMSAGIGELKGPVAVGDGAVAFQVTEQKRVTPQELAKNAKGYIDVLRSQQARSLRAVLLGRLRQNAKVEVNRGLLAQPGSQQQGA